MNLTNLIVHDNIWAHMAIGIHEAPGAGAPDPQPSTQVAPNHEVEAFGAFAGGATGAGAAVARLHAYAETAVTHAQSRTGSGMATALENGVQAIQNSMHHSVAETVLTFLLPIIGAGVGWGVTRAFRRDHNN